MALTDQELASALRLGTQPGNWRKLAGCATSPQCLSSEFAPEAPDVMRDEATVRTRGLLVRSALCIQIFRF